MGTVLVFQQVKHKNRPRVSQQGGEGEQAVAVATLDEDGVALGALGGDGGLDLLDIGETPHSERLTVDYAARPRAGRIIDAIELVADEPDGVEVHLG